MVKVPSNPSHLMTGPPSTWRPQVYQADALFILPSAFQGRHFLSMVQIQKRAWRASACWGHTAHPISMALPQVYPFPGHCSHFFHIFPSFSFSYGPPGQSPWSRSRTPVQPRPYRPISPPLCGSQLWWCYLISDLSPWKPAVLFHPPRTCLVHPALPFVLKYPHPHSLSPGLL